jgi:hypothetical protein
VHVAQRHLRALRERAVQRIGEHAEVERLMHLRG